MLDAARERDRAEYDFSGGELPPAFYSFSPVARPAGESRLGSPPLPGQARASPCFPGASRRCGASSGPGTA